MGSQFTQAFLFAVFVIIAFCLLVYYVVDAVYRIVEFFKMRAAKKTYAPESPPPWYGKIIPVSTLDHSLRHAAEKKEEPVERGKDDSKKAHSTWFEKPPERPEENRRSPLYYIIRNWLLFFLAFIIPIVGAIIYVMWRDYHPKDARYPGIGALLGFILMFTVAFLPLFVN